MKTARDHSLRHKTLASQTDRQTDNIDDNSRTLQLQLQRSAKMLS